MKYNNPIIPGYYPDPSICRRGEWFYLVTSSFEYFPGVPIFKSKDLVNWQQLGHCLTRKTQVHLDKIRKSGGIYAPTIRYNNGRFYMVTTNVDSNDISGNFYVYTDDIEGEWSDPIWVDIGGIDPTLVFDAYGKTYIVTNEGTDGSFGHIVLAEIDIESGKLLSEVKELWKGTGGQYVEAPHIYIKDGYYYLMVAEGGTGYGHMVTIARAKSIWGPYESCLHNPILTHRERPNNPIQATGHGDLIEDINGDWWIVFLGIRPVDNMFHHLGRETFLAPVTWTDGGWPVVNDGAEVELSMHCNGSLKAFPLVLENCRDEFDSENPKLYWNYIRNPHYENYLLNGNGYLELTGTPIALDDVDSPTFIGRRQQHFECSATVSIELGVMSDRDEAGLTAFYSDEHHYEISIVMENGIKYIQVKKTVCDMVVIVAKEEMNAELIKSSKDIVLSIRADKRNYYFGWGTCEDDITEIASGRTQLISTEVASDKFTGTYFGLYCVSDAGTKVKFNCFDYKY